jgi:hypothetical protein
MAWSYFSGALSEASASLVTNANMMSKVYFPRLVLPLSSLIAKLLDFIITLLVMIVLLFAFNHIPTAAIVYFPLLVLLLLVTTFGPAIILAAWSVQYRDIKYAIDISYSIADVQRTRSISVVSRAGKISIDLFHQSIGGCGGRFPQLPVGCHPHAVAFDCYWRGSSNNNFAGRTLYV